MNATVTLVAETYSYSVSVSPAAAASTATFAWYEDSGLQTQIAGANANTLTSALNSVWVRVSATGYVPQTVQLTSQSTSASVTLNKEPYTYSVSVSPSAAASIATFAWYEDGEMQRKSQEQIQGS